MRLGRMIPILLPVGYMLLAVAVSTALTWCASARAAELESAVVEAGFYVPHNELVYAGQVARWEAGASGRVALGGRLALEGEGRALGLQGWRPSDVVGAGLSAWPGSDWGVERWGGEWLARPVVRLTDRLDAVVEYGRRGVTVAQGRYWLKAGLRWRLK